MTPPLGIIYAAGGSGGHIYPMLAVDDELRATRDIASYWVCSQRPLDAEILAAAGREPTPIPARQIARSPKALAALAWNWGGAIRATRAAIADLRAVTPRLVMLTTGGFVSAPAAQAAEREHVPIALLALDAVPGRASRFVARRAAALLSVYDLPNHQPVGPVIRNAAVASQSPADARAALGLDPDRPALLITGGSQGSASVTALVLALAEAHTDALARWQLIHQARPEDETRVRETYDRLGIRAHVAPLIDPIGTALAAADLALTRAGAGTVAELWAARLPAVLMPYPHHHDAHQTANARPLLDVGSAILATDHIDPAANVNGAGARLLELIASPDRLATMRTALARLPKPEGAARVATALAQLA